MDDLRPEDPRRIGPYWLEGRLGSGGMGDVYLGRSPGGRHVAIKVIRAELARDAEFRARFAREVTAVRKVSGIFTAEVVDADLHGPTPWLATSYVAGPSLADEVDAHGPLSPGVALMLAAGLAEGLVAIHSAGLVHRDLKPSNVLLAKDGPRLIDFGISRSVDSSALTRTGMVIGSPGFMSPEQARGREAGPPSDIFSLGAVLAFAATGKEPFGSGSGEALLHRVVSGEPDTEDVPRQIRPLVERCMIKDPRRRPTAAQLLAELSTAQSATRTQPAPALSGAGRAATLLANLPTEAASAAAGQAAAPEASIPTRATPAPFPPARQEPRRVPVPEQRPVPPAEQRPATPPQPPPPGRQPVPPRGRPPRRSGRIAVAVATVLIAAVAGAFVAWRAGYLGSPGPASSPGTSSSPSAPAQSPAAVMTTLGTYLARSASVRPAIQPAIDGVRTCSQTPASGQASMQQPINTRQDILNGLRTLSPSGLPNGAQLISALTAAMRQSVTADRYYQTWMADFGRLGYACGSDPSQNTNYLAGQNASAQATAAKKAFLDIWNPMAPSYGQKTYSYTGF
jgi:eukaryotic-like serine/threonine-protein kinase